MPQTTNFSINVYIHVYRKENPKEYILLTESVAGRWWSSDFNLFLFVESLFSFIINICYLCIKKKNLLCVYFWQMMEGKKLNQSRKQLFPNTCLENKNSWLGYSETCLPVAELNKATVPVLLDWIWSCTCFWAWYLKHPYTWVQLSPCGCLQVLTIQHWPILPSQISASLPGCASEWCPVYLFVYQSHPESFSWTNPYF